jgi:LPXTG-site transpeptidase (sortase) family protein
MLFVQGTDELSLEKGPGHYPSTAPPGLGQTVAIAGRRTTYLAPFRHLDALGRGDQNALRTLRLSRPVPPGGDPELVVDHPQRRL